MQRNQSIEAYCSNIRCGEQEMSASGSVPVRSRRHRRMVYSGSQRVGILSAAIKHVVDPEDPVESGTYHMYSCPVCGQEKYFIEKHNRIRLWA